LDSENKKDTNRTLFHPWNKLYQKTTFQKTTCHFVGPETSSVILEDKGVNQWPTPPPNFPVNTFYMQNPSLWFKSTKLLFTMYGIVEKADVLNTRALYGPTSQDSIRHNGLPWLPSSKPWFMYESSLPTWKIWEIIQHEWQKWEVILMNIFEFNRVIKN